MPVILRVSVALPVVVLPAVVRGGVPVPVPVPLLVLVLVLVLA